MMCMNILAYSLIFLTLCASAQDVGSSARVASVKVATAAPSATNRALTIWYSVPAGYSAQQAVPSRILVMIFGGRNASGKEEVSGILMNAQRKTFNAQRLVKEKIHAKTRRTRRDGSLGIELLCGLRGFA